MVSSREETVEVHKYVSESSQTNPNPTNIFRLPNDMRERNALFNNEVDRSMSGVAARVRNVRGPLIYDLVLADSDSLR
jgi:hypothetical protein